MTREHATPDALPQVLVAANNDDSLVLRGRKGLVRLALSHGADLLPTYCFHKTDVFFINTTLLQVSFGTCACTCARAVRCGGQFHTHTCMPRQ